MISLGLGLGIGLLSGASRSVQILAPRLNQLAMPGVPIAISATVPAGTTSVTVKLGTHAAVAMTLVGTSATASVTPDSTDIGTATAVLITTADAIISSTTIDVEANGAFWIDASNASSYTATGANLTALKSLLTGTALSTITGTPQVVTSPGDGLPAFQFKGTPDYVLGADATYTAAVAGTDKAFTSIAVIHSDDCTTNGFYDSVTDSASASIGQEFGQLSGGVFTTDKTGAGGYKAASERASRCGTLVISHRSTDGLTVYTSINGDTETSTVLTSAGAITADRVAIGVAGHATPVYPFQGYIRERISFSVGKTAADCARMTAALIKKWKPAPQVQAVGDSISTGQLATNGGMVKLLADRVRSAGMLIDPTGPIAVANGFYPYRYSAVSGNTCLNMNTRITSATQGLGTSSGHFLGTKLVLLMAGTNPGTPSTAAQTATDYTTLLNNIYAALMQGDTTARIAVTTICGVTANSAYSLAFNALLPAIWNTFDSAHPATPLIRWDAYNANPNDGSNTYFSDGTHPNDAGYVRMVDNATYGLAQAVLPYLATVQPS